MRGIIIGSILKHVRWSWIPAFAGMTLFFLFSSAVPANALSLSPALVEVNAEPGETLIQKMRLFNETNQTITVYPGLENFQPQKDSSQPKFLGDSDPFGAARWIEMSVKQVTLKSGEAKDILLRIKVSALAEPGGHYAALFWSNQPGKNLGIGSASRVASLFLFKVKGTIKEDARIVSFAKKENDWPLEFSLRLENLGSMHFVPHGSIEIVNWRDKKIDEIIINSLGQSILPQSQRQFDASLAADKLSSGLYSARVKLFYGESSQELNSKINFWIMPSALGSKLLGLIVIIILIWIGVKIAKRKSRVFILFILFSLLLASQVLAISSSTSGTTTVSGTYTKSGGGCTGCGGGGTGDTGDTGGDTTAPSAVTNLLVDAMTDTTATLTWTAPGDDNNSGTASQYDIRYSLATITADNWADATSISNEPTVQVSGSSQSVIISNLTPNILYYFAIKTADEKPNWSNLSNVASASTLPASQQPADTTPPEITQIIVRPGIFYATISWITNESADSQVFYGLINQLGSSKTSADFVTDHAITLSGLIPNTTYYFKIISSDATGNQSIGLYNGAEIGTFKTEADTTAPANVSNFKATGGDKKNYLIWHNPSDSDFQGVLLVRNSSNYPTNTEDGDGVFLIKGIKNTDISYTDSKNLVNGQTYYYTAFAMDLYENTASGAMAQATPVVGSQPPASGGVPQCSDSADNDGDGYKDYPSDLGCFDPSDNDETESSGESAPVGPGGEPFTSGSGGAGASIIELQLSDFVFSVAKGKIIVPNNFNISALAGSGLQVSLSQIKSSKMIDSIIVNVAGGSYLFSLQNGQWQTEISAPASAGIYQAVFLVNFSDQTKNIVSWQMESKTYGQIYEKVNGQKKALSVVTILLWQNGALWPANDFWQSNPQVTGADGLFGFLVPAGNYLLQIEKDGYSTEKINLMSDDVIIHPSVELLFVPPLLKDVIDLSAPVSENLQNIAKNLGEKAQFIGKKIGKEVGQSAQKALGEAEKIITNPENQKIAEQVAAPVAAGAAAAAATASVGWVSLLNYLRFLFTQPALLFKRRKRKNWGVIYNSLTKLPLGLMTVRLIDVVSGRIVQSRVTDGEGRYAFFPAVGSYKLEISTDQFDFPSQFFGGLHEDGQFVDLYHGEIIEVKEKGATITANIPLDPVGAERPVGHLIWQLAWRHVQNILSIVSILVAVGFAVWVPGIITGGLLAVQIAFYALFRHLAIPPKLKNWGIIYDEYTRSPLTQAIARIFDKQYNKLLETQITDKSGRYAFLVGRNEYYVTYEKGGYEKKQSMSIDLKNSSEPVASVGVDTGLKPTGLELESSGDKNDITRENNL
ncbi:MAG TPA: hypothetical protein DEB73_01620 [Candidatus Magasanikbacteria bacterium]|uniref:Fibronectin type III domain-containing protein n=2 Tax=Candidatus Magasanikiibacteriota TaxID=1752731 RepID=A0A0G0WKB5_9BACT|nr:MAG: Fibronectin type III domain-containing protein [Candidatus Magasanikbacteria bacterium GW2011_GWC2_41_17]KKS13270.1 MAG: Fibronectin type III domain-containing protein [Candidatus Magasanikbacteria bacterium GW2011_GWA2_41_55]HBV57945.1 hypothetical protein [Candidatus Magasanikbacteria bacterium]HBX15707.1 hypothetical protein [Candidatus Magasanikbacteria bacterium]